MTVARWDPPVGPLAATIPVPGSKSVANRALVCAMLADGVSRISGLPDGDDTQVVLRILEQMGATRVDGGLVSVTGSTSPRLPGIVDCALAGTSSRFLTAVAALGSGVTLIDGGTPLRSRPMADLHDALVALGAVVEPLGASGRLPVSVSRGAMTGGRLSMRADVSSQFVSALMLIAPLLPGGLVLELDGHVVSGSYIAMTARVMAAFGVHVELSGHSIVVPESAYVPTDYQVEPDFSSAAFPIAAVLIRGGRVRIEGLASSMEQGDSEILSIAEACGATWRTEDGAVTVEHPGSQAASPAGGLTFSMEDCSDLVPAVAVAMAVRSGRASIRGVGFIRMKESDRLGDLASEMAGVGLMVRDTVDGLDIVGGAEMIDGVMSTHHDHRLAMAFSLLALVHPGVAVADPAVVSKSWPGYLDDMVDILGPPRLEN